MTQLSGIKGLVQSPSGEIIELPIQSSLIEGFSPIEYFIAAHGARKGKADTALRTAESGYLTRRLCDSSQEVIVRKEDCGTTSYIAFSKEEAELRGEPYKDLIFGRVLTSDAVDADGNVIVHAGDMLDKKNVKLIIDADVTSVKVRSPMTCKVISGVCQKCFGMDLATRRPVDIGMPVGIISSQSIGEPGTQLTMRTFHAENVAGGEGGDVTQGIRRVEELFEVRKPKKSAIVAPFDGKIFTTEAGKQIDVEIIGEPEPKPYIIKDGYKALVKVGQEVKKGDDYAISGKSKLKLKEEGLVLEVHKDYITVGVVHRYKKSLS